LTSSDTKDVQLLRDLGLTLLEAKIYSTLERIGVTKVTTISTISKVSRPDVYRNLHRLLDLGLVEKLLGTPSKWKALPLETGLSFLLKKRRKKTELLEKKKKKILTDIKIKKKLNFNYPESQFMIIPKKKAIISWIQNSLESTRFSNDVICYDHTFSEVMYYCEKYFINSLNKRVKFRIILNRSKNNESDIVLRKEFKSNPNFIIKYCNEDISAALGIHDKKIAIISTRSKDPNERPSLVSDNPCFVETLHQYFELFWEKLCNEPTI
jgi:sugar-specific transcriptional regulator TrmB